MGRVSLELWAVIDDEGRIAWTRGGSSTSQKLMVFDSEKKATSSINNYWTQLAHDKTKLRVKKIYSLIDKKGRGDAKDRSYKNS